MAYQSVDELQKLLVKDVFHYADDAKKAAGAPLAHWLRSSRSTH